MKKLLVSSGESSIHVRLIALSTDEEVYVCPKVGLKEIFEYDKLPKELASHRDYCWKAHLDFLIVSSEYKPLFAVEFDGPLHLTDQITQARDEKKYRLCAHFGLPILRIKSNYLNAKYQGFDLLGWFVACYFSQSNFYGAQAHGFIPMDEDFTPWTIVKSHHTNQLWPFWLSRNIMAAFRRHQQAGLCLTLPSQALWNDLKGNHCIISWLKLTATSGLVVQSAMRSQQFPISEDDALDEIIMFELYEEFGRVQQGVTNALSVVAMKTRLQRIGKQNQIGRFGGVADELLGIFFDAMKASLNR